MVQNPFADLSCAPQTNEDRIEFIPRTTIDRVIAACPNLEREVIFALARYGGARVPSRSFRRYAPVSNGLTTSASPGRSTRCREQWGGPSSALDAQQFAGPPPALPETDRRRLRASHRLPGAKPDTFSGHLEPSTLHYASEKSLDFVKDPKNQYPRQGSNKRSVARRKPEKGKSPGANSGTTKRSGRRGQSKKANGRKGGAR